MDYYKNTKEFITSDQEFDIRKLVPQNEKPTGGRNQILRYGARIPYSSDMVSATIPDVFLNLNLPFEFDSVTINEYYPGQRLDWHIDKPEGGKEINILNLVNSCPIYFKRGMKTFAINLEPRELFIFGGELRYKWQHMVNPDRYRISVVFRNSKHV